MVRRKRFNNNFFYLKQLKFEHRKVVHYTLLVCIMLLQVVAIVTWYNETKLSKAFDDMSSSNKILKYTNLLNNSLIQSQVYFNDYINNHETSSLQKYATTLNGINNLSDSLHLVARENPAFAKTLKEKINTEQELLILKTSIDSMVNRHSVQLDSKLPSPYEFEEFAPKTILDNVKTNSFIKVTKANRKGLFSRLADAFAGRVSIQKEYLNTVVTMQYKDKVTTGTVENQLANSIHIANNYYENQFAKLKKSFSDLRTGDLKLMTLNNKLLQLSMIMSADYNGYPNMLFGNNLKNIKDQYETGKAVRSYAIILLILLMFVISIILFNFTRIAFEYEKILTEAQDQIRQSLNFKNRITGMISHEIRSPLSIISLYSKKAGASTHDTALKETFKSIEFTTNSLLLLSNQILEYSKAENHTLSLDCQSIDLKTEIDQVITSMTALVATKNNKLEVTSNLESTATVYSDAAKVYQLFYNIIGNANKFTENGWIKVSLDLEVISAYEMNLKVVISDNGMGIAEGDLKNIFESYYQGTVSEKVNNLGVGLGLNICKEIIELFDGEIRINSTAGQGTNVAFNLILTQL